MTRSNLSPQQILQEAYDETARALRVTGSSVFEPIDPNVLASGEETVSREKVVTTATCTSGALRLSYFTARKTEAITQIRLISAGTAAGATPTLVRAAIYSVDPSTGALTELANIANDTTIFAAANTEYLRSLNQTFNKVAGTRYAWGPIVVTGATAPTVPVRFSTLPTTALGRSPRFAGTMTGLTDLPASPIVQASITAAGNLIYAELVP